MLRFDLAAVIAAVKSPLQLCALGLILAFLFASLVWLSPRPSNDPRSQQTDSPPAECSAFVRNMDHWMGPATALPPTDDACLRHHESR